MRARSLNHPGWTIVLGLCAVAEGLTGCGPTRVTIKPEIPPLLMTPMPLAMGVRIPKSFAEYVQKEKSQEREWEITLGPGQAEAIRRVTAAMFERTLVLGDEASGDASNIAAQKLNGILETSVDSYVYLLPSPGGAEYYSATIGYKVNLLSVDGKVLGSWIYEGYGSAPERGLGSAKGVARVTALAVRDACANLAVHLPDQELVRNLLTPAPSPSPAAPAPGAGDANPARQRSPGEAAPVASGAAASTSASGPAATQGGTSNGQLDPSVDAQATPDVPRSMPASDPDPATTPTDASPASPASPGTHAPAIPSAVPVAPAKTPTPEAAPAPPSTGN